MYEEANTYNLLSHFLWGTWSVLQNDMSNIQFAFMVSVANEWMNEWMNEQMNEQTK